MCGSTDSAKMGIFPLLAFVDCKKFQNSKQQQWNWLHYFAECYLNLCSQNIAFFSLSRSLSNRLSGMQILNDELCIHQFSIWKWTIKPCDLVAFDVCDGCARRPNQNQKPRLCAAFVEQIKPFSWRIYTKNGSDIKNANNNQCDPDSMPEENK